MRKKPSETPSTSAKKCSHKPRTTADFRIGCAQSHFELADVLRAENRLDEAVKYYRLADAAWRKLADEFSQDFPYRAHVIEICTNQLGPFLRKIAGWVKPTSFTVQRSACWRSLPASELVADDRRDLTDTCYGNLVRLLKSRNRPQEATAVFREWVDLRRKAFTKSLAQNPKSAAAQHRFGDALARLGLWDEALGGDRQGGGAGTGRALVPVPGRAPAPSGRRHRRLPPRLPGDAGAVPRDSITRDRGPHCEDLLARARCRAGFQSRPEARRLGRDWDREE